MNKIIIISGATAVGKTELSIELAKRLNTEIISCDSRQIYKELTIGTAKPSKEEMKGIPHHFINHISIEEDYSVGQFQKEAIIKLKELFKTHQNVIVSGGTGLYIKSLLQNLDDFPIVPEEILAFYNEKFKVEGIVSIQKELQIKDIDYYEKVDIDNPRRILRALSIIKVSGTTFSSFLKKKKQDKFFESTYIVLQREREDLYDRINKRVDLMVKKGLIEEAKSLTSYVPLKALKTVGYQELFPYFNGEYSLEFALDKIKQHSRNYAKRQITWFRKIENSIHLDAKNIEVEKVLKIVENSP